MEFSLNGQPGWQPLPVEVVAAYIGDLRVTAMMLSPDGKKFAQTEDGGMWMWCRATATIPAGWCPVAFHVGMPEDNSEDVHNN